MDRLADLEMFIHIARRGSLLAAARELGMSGPAVSKRLAALEGRLGVRLVQRTTRRLRITPEGEAYLEQGREVLGSLDALEATLRGAVQAPQGMLRINASFGFGRQVVAGLASRFMAIHPAMRVHLELTDRPLDLVKEGLDVGIQVGETRDSRLSARQLLQNSRRICSAPDYLARRGTPSSLADLTDHDIIVIQENERTYGSWSLQNERQHQNLRVRGSMTTNDGQVATAWAREGRGLVLRSEWEIRADLDAGRLQLVLPQWSMRADVYALYPTKAQLPVRTRAFVDFMADALAAQKPGATDF
jgi:LysR family transcriptional regulator, transcriptional activator for dmlA